MSLDLRALVAETIVREEKELDERLEAARKKQREAEEAVAEDLLLLQYAEEEVAKDPALAMTWDALRLSTVLRDIQKISTERSSVDGVQDRPSPLGLTPEKVVPCKTEVKEFQEKIIPRVALRIEKDRDSLLQFCHPISQIQSATSPTPLCDSIENLLSRVEVEKTKMFEEEEKREKILVTLVNCYNNLFSTMLQLLRESYPIIVQQQVFNIRQNLSKFKCLHLKAKAAHWRLLAHTYTPKKVQGLKVVRYSLDKKIAEVEKEYTKWSSALRAFDAVDPEFSEVVREFKTVLEDIKTQQYILDQFT